LSSPPQRAAFPLPERSCQALAELRRRGDLVKDHVLSDPAAEPLDGLARRGRLLLHAGRVAVGREKDQSVKADLAGDVVLLLVKERPAPAGTFP